MKRIRVKEDKPLFCSHEVRDTKRLVEVFRKKGYNISSQEARLLWEQYSSSLTAGWLIMPATDEAVFEKVRPYFEVIDED